MSIPVGFWIGFLIFVGIMLVLDLGVFHRDAHEVSIKEASLTFTLWMVLAFAFNILVYFWWGPEPALEFLTGFLVEKALSMDNMFVFVLIFSYFNIPKKYQHEVLFWGILGALVMRASFIALGATLISKFNWILYVFGAFLVYTGIKMLFEKDDTADPGNSIALRAIRKFMPVTQELHGQKFFVRENGRLMATPLFAVLLVVELSDVIFAVDSIPAIFGITTNTFIVFTSNIFAIMGMRSLYFLVSGVLEKFRFFKYGLSAVLTFVGLKMLAEIIHIEVSHWVSLGVILAALGISIVLSLLIPDRDTEAEMSSHD